jgi:outer membrane protein TolC
MTGNPECRLRRIRLRPASLAIAINFLCVIPAAGQYPAGSLGGGQATALTGSVPSGPAADEVVQPTLRDALKMALRYNLGAVESGQNAQIARGQRLLALSYLLPQVSAGASETVQQVNLATFGLNELKARSCQT